MAKPAKIDKTNAMRLLDAAGVSYRSHTYQTDDGQIDGVSVAQKVGFPLQQVYKTLVTSGNSNAHYVFVIPVAEELDLKKAAKAANEKNIAMLPSKDLLKLTGYIHGGCSPVGMKKPFPTFFQKNAANLETMLVSAGKIGQQIEAAPQILLEITGGQYADLIK